MLSGKDRGKSAKVLNVFAPESKYRGATVVVEGLNTVKRHQRARKQGQKGQILTKERAVSISSVALVCTKCAKATRVGYRVDGENKYRICKKCGAEI